MNLLSHHKGDDTNGKEDGSTLVNDNIGSAAISNTNSEQGDVIIDVDSHPAPPTTTTITTTPERTWTSQLIATLQKARGLLQPPLITAIVALFVGLVRPLHHILMDPDSKVFIFLIKPLDTCGRAAVPMILLCLGAQVLSFDSNTPADPAKAVSSLRTATATSSTANSSRAPTPYGTALSSEPQHSNGIDARRGSSSSNGSSTSGSSNESSPLLNRSTVATTSSQKSTSDQHRHPHPVDLESHSKNQITHRKYNNSHNPIPFILFCRMLLSPLITLPAILLVPNSLSPDLLNDPIFRLTMVMLSASPTAVNMMQICQINGFFEKKMARLLFWSYCVVGVPGILVWVMVALQASTWGS